MSSLPENLLQALMTLGDPNADIVTKRKALSDAEHLGLDALRPIPSDLEEFWVDIKLSDGWVSKTLIIKPKETSPKPCPLIVFFHGGGYSMGEPLIVFRPDIDWAKAYGAVVALPSYKLAPEDLFPAAMHGSWEVLVHLSKVAEKDFGAKLDGPDGGFVIGGCSAGGGVSEAMLGIHAFGDGGSDYVKLSKPLTGAFMNTPVLAVADIIPEKHKGLWISREENAISETITTEGINQFLRDFNPDYHSPWFSPLNAVAQCEDAKKAAAACPRVYIQTGHYDPLRDDGIVLGRLLSDLGVEVKEDCFSEDGHVGWTTIGISAKTPGVPECTMSGMGWLLGK
ncbi:hypothetical protein CEP54_016113 [Fusarium duplospermum]|uniref:Alpha/beta hydrolase fold-3 domain-containing protein n=1 Tax=Fusarium duplospermum TaxID=1325734 RepID=A0A428NI27_9HYPO|nr:hypothetical protein CEP54_016113 [Fusarium duplospermum]